MPQLELFHSRRLPELLERTPSCARYRVPALKVALFHADAGDQICIVDPEGMQEVQIQAYDQHGKPDSELLPKHPPLATAELSQWLQDNTQLEATSTTGIQLSAANSRPNQRTYLNIKQALSIYIAAPAQFMAPDQPVPPTDIIVEITSANDEALDLPPALATPNREIRVNACTAEGFTVKAGEFIQVIDVSGQQCSDFVAYDAKALEKGTEVPICPTTTRSLMAQAYPLPGLNNKYYNGNMETMVELIQDTIGRHDTFNLACSAKYYDDIGYPGHVNCSDNLNAALADYQIAAKKSWPAINFFFNTGYDDYNYGTGDQPWSRAGDYVLLQAATDLVCGVTACPDDTSNANNWQPSDIHVRIYSSDCQFQKGNAFRKTPESDFTMTKKTAFHDNFAKLTRHFIDYNGYWLANHFNNYGPIAEYWACREGVAMMDLSPLRKYEVYGPDAEKLLNYCVTRNIQKLAIGQVVYTAMCYENGGMIDDGTVYRLSDSTFRWVGGCDSSGLWLRKIAEQQQWRVYVKDSTDQLHNLPVQGPMSRTLLDEVIFTPECQTSVMELGWFRITNGRIGGPQGAPVVISRTGYTGELGYEVWCHPRHGDEVWQAIWDAGQKHNIAPLGLEALDMLRIEAGLIFADYEFCDQTDPFEAGISFTVPLKSKEADFIGKQALIARKASPQRQLVGLLLEGQEVAEHGDCVRIGKQQVGIITSACRSPVLDKNIALCRMSTGYTEIGTQVEVGKLDGHIKRLNATVCGLSHYDPTKSRVREG